MQVSAQGTAFIAAHEGFASRAYRCPAGVVTIGYGFTMGSRVVASWCAAKFGRGLQMGDTITRPEADTLLAALLNNEYGAAVSRKLGDQPQHRWDGSSSVSFNCGTGALGWKWARALAEGKIAEAATLLRTTACTANGRTLPGLVRRRSEEARLIETGNYGRSQVSDLTAPSTSSEPADVKWYQAQLKTLGYDVKVTGDPATSDAAVRKFQKDSGLNVDGVVGPATRATIIRAIDAKRQNQTAGGAGGGGVIAGGTADPSMTTDMLLNALLIGGGLALVAFAIFLFFRYRGRLTGQRVPT